MKNNILKNIKPVAVNPDDIPEEITEDDQKLFLEITATELNTAQEKIIIDPQTRYPRQENVLAIHWHPEFIPMPMIQKRVEALFPNKQDELIIPTQHNQFTEYGPYSGVEVDCYSKGFDQKVQLLLHFETKNVKDADILKSMIDHTFKYRSTQLFAFIDSIVKPDTEKINTACYLTGADGEMVRFVQIYVKKIAAMIDQNASTLAPEMIKNKILRNFFDGLRPQYNNYYIDRVQTFLKTVKQLVKDNFSLNYFYRTSEFIEEARANGAGIVIPHPEQFWPILMANYDVDGVEVWNPQSHRYSKFLISVISNQNKSIRGDRRPLLIMMGDDTHMSEKIRDPSVQNQSKAAREIGFQPAWDDFNIRKELIHSLTDRSNVINEYKARLAG